MQQLQGSTYQDFMENSVEMAFMQAWFAIENLEKIGQSERLDVIKKQLKQLEVESSEGIIL